MKKLKIALLAGGDSSEREVSLGSAGQVYQSLDKDKYEVYLIDVRANRWVWNDPAGGGSVDLNDFSLTTTQGKVRFDYALIMIHGTPGEDGKMQGYLEMLGIPYSSCDLVSTVLTFDKKLCKKVVSEAGLTVAKHITVQKGEQVDPAEVAGELGLPVFVKPNASGSSCGVTKVKSAGELPGALEAAFDESDTVLIESFVEGRELACGIYSRQGEPVALPVTEIIPKNEFFDYEAKYTPGMSQEITPADISPELAERIASEARAAYRACGCRGVVRIDFIATSDETPYFIEVNSVPGMSSGSLVPQQAACAGISLGELFDHVICETIG